MTITHEQKRLALAAARAELTQQAQGADDPHGIGLYFAQDENTTEMRIDGVIDLEALVAAVLAATEPAPLQPLAHLELKLRDVGNLFLELLDKPTVAFLLGDREDVIANELDTLAFHAHSAQLMTTMHRISGKQRLTLTNGTEIRALPVKRGLDQLRGVPNVDMVIVTNPARLSGHGTDMLAEIAHHWGSQLREVEGI